MKNKGVTFIEILIVALIMGIITGMMLSAFMQTNSLFQTVNIPATQQAAIRRLVNSMALDLNSTSRPQIQITQDFPYPGCDRIRYRLPQYSSGQPVLSGLVIVWDSDIFINLDPAGTGRLLKTQGGNVRVLADNVNSINFFDQSRDATLAADELKIILNLRNISPQQRVYNMGSTSIVNMRN